MASLFCTAPPSALAQDLSPRLELVGEWPACPPAYANDVAPHGDYAYFVGGNGFRVLNVSDPANPYPEEPCHPEWPGDQVLVQGDYAYVCWPWENRPTMPHLRTIDLTDPAHPQEGGFVDLGPRYDLTLAGVSEDGFVFLVANEPDGLNLLVVDVIYPLAPLLPYEDIVTPFAHLGDSRPGAIALVGDRLYVAATESVVVIDVSDRINPKLIGAYDGDREQQFRSITVSGDTAYVYDEPVGGSIRPSQLLAIDMTDPGEPQRVGAIDVNYYAALYANPQGSYLYGLCGSDNAFEVLDVTDPSRPIIIRRVEGWDFTTLKVSGGFGYTTKAGGSEVGLIDLRDPPQPKLLSIYEEYVDLVYDVVVREQLVYLACSSDGMRIMDVSDPAAPKQVGHYAAGSRVGRVELSEDETVLAAVVDYSSLQLLGLEDPLHPQLLGEYKIEGLIRSLVLSGDLGCVEWGTGAGMPRPPSVYDICDISDPGDPKLVFDLDSLFATWSGAALADGYLYGYSTVEEEWVFTVVDLSDPSDPRVVGTVAAEPCGVGAGMVRNGYLFQPCHDQGLVVMDVSDPTTPQLVAEHPTSGDAWNLALSGNYLCMVGAAGSLLEVFDVSDPTNPRLVAYTPDHHSGAQHEVVMEGNRIYAAAGQYGFQIFDLILFELKATRRDGQLQLSWDGFPGVTLQRTDDLAHPSWEDVPGSEFTEQMSLPIDAQRAFYRLVP